MKPNIANNLKMLMKLANISENELSRRTKVKQPIIHRLLSGENKNPKLLTIKPIADYFMLSVSQLIGECKIESQWTGFTSKNHNGWVEVPLINWDKIHAHSKYKISKTVKTECVVSKDAFALYVSDQSMEPLFPETCITIIEPSLKPVNGNYIVIKNNKRELLLRHFLMVSEDKFFTPLNHNFGTICKLLNKDEILGTVIRTIFDHIIIEKSEA